MSQDAQIKLTLDAAEARKKLDRFRDELRETTETASRAGEAAGGAISSGFNFRGAVGAAALQGGLGALATPGGGGTDALLNGMQALGAIMQAEGTRIAAGSAAAGDAGGAARGLAQAATGALIQRNVTPELRAREAAISEAAALTDRFAVTGRPVSDATMQALVQQLTELNRRSERNRARARGAQPSAFDFLGG